MAISSPLIDLLRSVQGEGARRLVAEHLESVAVNDDHAQQKRVLRELVEKFVALERQVSHSARPADDFG